MNSEEIKATIFIPTFNGEKYIKEIINAILKQKYEYNFEILIIDSGSTDNTLTIINKFTKKHNNLRLHQIPNEEFGHGKTRNLAAKMARGEFVVYLSHDAIPSHKYWLYELLRPFELSPLVAGVVGKQIPRVNCPPMLKYEIMFVFNQLGPNHATTLYYKDNFVNNVGIKNALSFYSDVNSATRREIILNKVPYQDVKYSEDQLFGRDIIEKGYIKAYAPRGSVVHSNDLRLREYSKRMFDETLGLRTIGLIDTDNNRMTIKNMLRGTIGDTIRIIRDSSYPVRQKLHLLIINPLFHLEKARGVRRALRVDLKDHSAHDKHSLESAMQKNSFQKKSSK